MQLNRFVRVWTCCPASLCDPCYFLTVLCNTKVPNSTKTTENPWPNSGALFLTKQQSEVQVGEGSVERRSLIQPMKSLGDLTPQNRTQAWQIFFYLFGCLLHFHAVLCQAQSSESNNLKHSIYVWTQHLPPSNSPSMSPFRSAYYILLQPTTLLLPSSFVFREKWRFFYIY